MADIYFEETLAELLGKDVKKMFCYNITYYDCQESDFSLNLQHVNNLSEAFHVFAAGILQDELLRRTNVSQIISRKEF